MIQLYLYPGQIDKFVILRLHWTKKNPQWQEEDLHRATPARFLLIKWIISVVTGWHPIPLPVLTHTRSNNTVYPISHTCFEDEAAGKPLHSHHILVTNPVNLENRLRSYVEIWQIGHTLIYYWKSVAFYGYTVTSMFFPISF